MNGFKFCLREVFEKLGCVYRSDTIYDDTRDEIENIRCTSPQDLTPQQISRVLNFIIERIDVLRETVQFQDYILALLFDDDIERIKKCLRDFKADPEALGILDNNFDVVKLMNKINKLKGKQNEKEEIKKKN